MTSAVKEFTTNRGAERKMHLLPRRGKNSVWLVDTGQGTKGWLALQAVDVVKHQGRKGSGLC